MSPTRNPMPTQDPILRGKNFSEVALGYTEEMAIDEAMRCLNCKNMPCVDGCPVKIRIPDFIAKIREGDFMCLSEGKLVHNSRRFEDVAKKLAKTMCSRQSGFITVFSGEGSDENTDKAVEEAFKSAAPNAEINMVPGGQPVYAYIVSVE